MVITRPCSSKSVTYVAHPVEGFLYTLATDGFRCYLLVRTFVTRNGISVLSVRLGFRLSVRIVEKWKVDSRTTLVAGVCV